MDAGRATRQVSVPAGQHRRWNSRRRQPQQSEPHAYARVHVGVARGPGAVGSIADWSQRKADGREINFPPCVARGTQPKNSDASMCSETHVATLEVAEHFGTASDNWPIPRPDRGTSSRELPSPTTCHRPHAQHVRHLPARDAQAVKPHQLLQSIHPRFPLTHDNSSRPDWTRAASHGFDGVRTPDRARLSALSEGPLACSQEDLVGRPVTAVARERIAGDGTTFRRGLPELASHRRLTADLLATAGLDASHEKFA